MKREAFQGIKIIQRGSNIDRGGCIARGVGIVMKDHPMTGQQFKSRLAMNDPGRFIIREVVVAEGLAAVLMGFGDAGSTIVSQKNLGNI